MLSRVAEAVYWVQRYVERAENVARFIDVNLQLVLDLQLDESQQWQPLVATSGDQLDFQSRHAQADRDSVLEFLSFDEQNPNSIVSCLSKARENARTIREIISSEMWEQVNRFYLMVRAAADSRHAFDTSHAFYSEVKMTSHLFTGVTDSTMSHNEAWQFGRLGRLCERADKTARILDVKYFLLLPGVEYVGTPYDTALWSALLKSASAFEMYRKVHGRVQPARVAAFLVLDREFPRSMRFCLAQAEECMRAITGSPLGTYSNLAEQRLGRLRAELDYANVEEIVAGGIHQYLDDFEAKLNDVGQAVFDVFFALTPVVQQQQQRIT